MKFRHGCFFAAWMTGCAIHAPVATQPSDPNAMWFMSSAAQLKCSYPKTWHAIVDNSVLCLVPLPEQTHGIHRLLILMPDLPPHIPYLIPLGLAVDVFVDGVKKRYKDVDIQTVRDRQIGGLDGKEIDIDGIEGNRKIVLVAVVCVKGDHVIVINAKTDPAGVAAANEVFNAVVDSLQWIN